MDIYSPSAQKPESFRKNTARKSGELVNQKGTIQKPTEKKKITMQWQNKKEEITRNGKFVLTGRSMEFDLNRDKRKAEQETAGRKPVTSFFDFLKIRFIDRMKAYFDYEDKYDERLSKKTWID